MRKKGKAPTQSKLVVTRETLRPLSEASLKRVHGGNRLAMDPQPMPSKLSSCCGDTTSPTTS